MHVLQVMAGGQHGGAERFFEDLASALARSGVEQTCAVRGYPDRMTTLAESGCRSYAFSFGGPLDVVTPWRLRRLAREIRPQIVLGWMNRACRILPRGPWTNVGRLGGYYDLKYYRRCHHLICNTPDIRDYVVKEGWPADRAHFIPNFSPVSPEPAADRSVFNTPPDVPVLLVLARLHEVKGIDVALRALASIPGAILWIAGSGSQERELHSLAGQWGVSERVRWLGWREDRSALLKAADLCLVPSRHEPFGNVVINAWAHDVPLVATDSEGPRFLIHDGRDALLVPVDDPQSMARAAGRILENPELGRQLASEGQLRIAREFSEEIVVSRYRELLEHISR